MIKKHLKILILTSVVILLPILAGLFLWDRLPEEVPIHWNMNGEADQYSSKLFAVICMPLLFVALQWVAVLVTSADPKRQNQSEKVKHLVFWLVPVISILIPAFMYFGALGIAVRIDILLPILLGLLFVAIGNYLPKCRQSYTIGIKLPWTLANEENWNRTHRFAGWVWAFGGILLMVFGFFQIHVAIIAVATVMVLFPIVYSFALYRKGV